MDRIEFEFSVATQLNEGPPYELADLNILGSNSAELYLYDMHKEMDSLDVTPNGEPFLKFSIRHGEWDGVSESHKDSALKLRLAGREDIEALRDLCDMTLKHFSRNDNGGKA